MEANDAKKIGELFSKQEYTLKELGFHSQDLVYWRRNKLLHLPESVQGSTTKYTLEQAMWFVLLFTCRDFGLSLPALKKVVDDFLAREPSVNELKERFRDFGSQVVSSDQEASGYNPWDDELYLKEVARFQTPFLVRTKEAIAKGEDFYMLIGSNGTVDVYFSSQLEEMMNKLGVDNRLVISGSSLFRRVYMTNKIRLASKLIALDYFHYEFFREIVEISPDFEGEILVPIKKKGGFDVFIKTQFRTMSSEEVEHFISTEVKKYGLTITDRKKRNKGEFIKASKVFKRK